ncbi:MAG: hypothetical protein RL095_1367 [Verrucomicrobiota bacterium]|jgi:dTMP kinase
MPQSRFIVLEGLEGAGKSGAAAALRQALESRGERVRLCREPGGTPLAEELRRLVKDIALNERVLPETELLMMFAARCQLVGNVIRPALEAGDWVICDRFFYSTYAYQGGGRGLPDSDIDAIRKASLGDFAPSLVLLLDLDPEIGLERARGRGALDRFEREKIDFFTRVRRKYLELAALDSSFRVIDASRSRAEVEDAVLAALPVRS